MTKKTCKIVKIPTIKDALAELEAVRRLTEKWGATDEFNDVWQALEDSRPAIEARIRDLERLTGKTKQSGTKKGKKTTAKNTKRKPKSRE